MVASKVKARPEVSIEYTRTTEFNRAILDSITAQVAVIDEQGTIIFCNRAWLDFRATISQFNGKPVRGQVGENYLHICEEIANDGCLKGLEAAEGVRSVLQGVKARFQLQYELTEEGSSWLEGRWFMLTVTPFETGGSGGSSAVVTHVDISAQMQAEQALRAERDRFQRMASVAPGVIHSYALRVDGTQSFVYASPSIFEIYGLTAEQLREDGFQARRLVHPEDAERIDREQAAAQATMSMWQSEFRVVHPTKGVIWVETRSSPVRESDGSLVWHGFLTDVTNRKKAEEALRRSEEHLRLAMGTAPMGTWELELDSYALKWSDNLWTMMGREPNSEALSLETYSSALHPDDRQRVLDALSQAIETGTVFRCEYRIMRPDGTMRWSLSHGRVVPDGHVHGKRRFIGVDLDITARKQLEDQFHQSQKMEAIGRLAGGVAHDFNNLLTVVNGYCYVLLAGLAEEDEKRQHVVAIRDAGERAARLTRQLLAFSRKTIASPQLLDLNVLLTNFEELLSRLVGEDVILALDLLPDRLLIQADPAQIEQVIVNLAVNARDAMGTGGRLIIRTNICTLSAPHTAAAGLLTAGNYAELTVTDTGCGMSSEIQAKVFEPFFTTKPIGKGTGLGLSVVHGIVTQSGGDISVQSQVDVGTTFRVMLPLVESSRADEPEGTTLTSSRGSETILLVEDEDSVRRIACVALETQGYRVLPASSASEGIELFTQHGNAIDLLVSDLVMPGMGGGQLAKELRRMRPSLKVLFISGYTEEICVQQGVMTSMEAFLAKPFKPSTLARKVRTILDQVEVG